MKIERLAPAKVNLYLHVGPLGADGYHPLASLVTFADIGDIVSIEDAPAMELALSGPFAGEVGAEDDNLVVRARRAVEAAFRPDWRPFRLGLEKRLPVASGLGGGSADAAAALQLMTDRSRLAQDAGDERTLFSVARDLGADVPMCLAGKPHLARGRGDMLSPPPAFPTLDAVLVNPLKPSPTGAVYRAYDAAGAPGDAEPLDAPESMARAADVARFLARGRNDLEAAAISLQPAIAEALAAMNSRPETLFARMSGSGATCFALCASLADRRALAAALTDAYPRWWVRDCALAGFSP